MDIYELLSIIQNLAKDNGLSTPFVVGGVPRDRVMASAGHKIKDVDLTSGDEDISKLSKLLGDKLDGANYRDYDDGHSSIDFQGLKIDFSNHFIVPGIEDELARLGIEDVTPMKKEMYSRDFTMNTLLEDMQMKGIYDITGEAVKDIEAGLIKCPIDPDITIGNDSRRILRAIYFSLKYDFKIEDNLKRAMLKHRENIKELPLKFVQTKMHDIIKIDKDAGLDALIEYKLLSLVDLNKPIYDALIQRRQLSRAYE